MRQHLRLAGKVWFQFRGKINLKITRSVLKNAVPQIRALLNWSSGWPKWYGEKEYSAKIILYIDKKYYVLYTNYEEIDLIYSVNYTRTLFLPSIIEFLIFWRNLEKGVNCLTSVCNEFRDNLVQVYVVWTEFTKRSSFSDCTWWRTWPSYSRGPMCSRRSFFFKTENSKKQLSRETELFTEVTPQAAIYSKSEW